mgnify:CR=1 FL=1
MIRFSKITKFIRNIIDISLDSLASLHDFTEVNKNPELTEIL